MRKTVAFIFSASFSGSSLLNALLDSQDGVRGIGEAIHLLRENADAWCSRCQRHVSECQLRESLDPERFYESVFARYSDARVLVNSSKTLKLCFREAPLPPSAMRVCILLLSKAPHEFAYSYSKHYSCSYEEAFFQWARYYREVYQELSEALALQGRFVDPQRRRPRIESGNITFLTYRQLASRPEATIERICRFLGVSFAALQLSLTPAKDTCTIGGNAAIYAQRTRDESFFGADSDYLAGKYAGRRGQVFLDSHWSADPPFVEFGRSWYAKLRDEERKIIRWLGHDASPPLPHAE